MKTRVSNVPNYSSSHQNRLEIVHGDHQLIVQYKTQTRTHVPNEVRHTFYQQGEHVLILLALRSQLDQHLQQDLKIVETRPSHKRLISNSSAFILGNLDDTSKLKHF